MSFVPSFFPFFFVFLRLWRLETSASFHTHLHPFLSDPFLVGLLFPLQFFVIVCVFVVSGLFISSLTMIVCCGYMLELINFFFFLLMQRISFPPFFLSFFRSGGGRIEAQTDKRTFSCYNRFFFGVFLLLAFFWGKKKKV